MGCSPSKSNETEQKRIPSDTSDKSVVDGKTLSSFDTRSRYSHRPLEDDFILETENILGEGFNGPVLKAHSRVCGKESAVKVLPKKGLLKHQLFNLHEEVNNYLKLDHPHIARLLHVYEDADRVCLVMELCSGRELFDKLMEKQQFSESEAKRAGYQMLLAVAYLHKHNVVHCDLKLENFLYESTSVNANLKLIDFGFSKTWVKKHQSAMSMGQGTLCYTAPEVLAGCFTEKCDIWSLGVVLFLMLGGHAPFPMDNEKEAHDKIALGEYDFKPEKWQLVSEVAKAFIGQCFCVNPDERMSADECLGHTWMKDRSQSDHSIMSVTPLLHSLRLYSESTEMKRAALTMVAHHLNSPELAGMKSMFLNFDTDHTGTITRDNFRRALTKDSTLALSEQELWKIFDSLDVAHDGEIHYSEFIAAMLHSRLKISDEVARETFELFDVSRTGLITCKDLERVFGADGFEEVDFATLISQCNGGDIERGITFEQFDELLRGSDASRPNLQSVPKELAGIFARTSVRQATKTSEKTSDTKEPIISVV
jgi:calcium-dependent protein kinase